MSSSKDIYHSIYIEGNKGGNYIRIKKLLSNSADSNMIRLESGHCCVISISEWIPIEWLTAMLSKILIDCNFDLEESIKSIGWDEDFSQQLINQYKQWNNKGDVK